MPEATVVLTVAEKSLPDFKKAQLPQSGGCVFLYCGIVFLTSRSGEVAVGAKISANTIENFCKTSKYVWHEDITGRVMLVPHYINTGGSWYGIPHIGLHSVYVTKNARAIELHKLVQKLNEMRA